MEGILTLVVIGFLVLPIITLCMTSSVGATVRELQETVNEVKELAISLQKQLNSMGALSSPNPESAPEDLPEESKQRAQAESLSQPRMQGVSFGDSTAEETAAAAPPEVEPVLPSMEDLLTGFAAAKPTAATSPENEPVLPPPLPDMAFAGSVAEEATAAATPENEPVLPPPLPDMAFAGSVAEETTAAAAPENEPVLPPPLPDMAFAGSVAEETTAAATPENEPVLPSVEDLLTGFAAKKPEEEDAWDFALQPHVSRLMKWLLSEGNIWVTVGVIILLVGFGLLFTYMAQIGWFSIELRLASSAAVGFAMTGFGWKLKDEKRTYALILQGGGIGVLYLVLFAGAKLGGGIIPVPVAIIGMLIISVFTVLLALLQDYEPLALFALLGGYAAPPLLSTGTANHVALFSIYSMLNFEILVLSTKRDWRMSRWSGLLASIFVGVGWGLSHWNEAYFASVEPFVVLFFLTYSAIICIPFEPRFLGGARFDFPLTVTLPFVFLTLQMGVASHTKYGIALTCLGMGAWYLMLARFMLKRDMSDVGKNLPDIFLGFSILFSNLAIPFIFKQAVASAVWSIEGAFLIVLAARNSKRSLLNWGIVLHVAALFLYNLAPYLHLPESLYGVNAVGAGLLSMNTGVSPFLLTGLLFAASSFVSSYFSGRCNFTSNDPSVLEKQGLAMQDVSILTWCFSVYGTIWWWLSVNNVFFTHLGPAYLHLSGFMVFSIIGAVAYLVSYRLEWRAVRTLMLPSVALVLLLLVRFNNSYPSIMILGAHFGLGIPFVNWLVFTLAFLCTMFIYRKEEPSGMSTYAWGGLLFAWFFLTFIAFGAFRPFAGWIDLGNKDLSRLISFLPVLCMALLFTREKLAPYCRMRNYENASRLAIAAILLPTLIPFLRSFDEYGMGLASIYIPFFNPLEIWQAAFMAALCLLLDKLREQKVRKALLLYAFPFLLFLWVNQIAARAAWWYFDEHVSQIGFFSGAPHFQAIIAILWGLTSLGLIFWGKRIPKRQLWFMGSGLLVLDIAKLMLFDLQNSATIIRIFAFLILGGFLLLIGWMAPLPPKAVESAEDE